MKKTILFVVFIIIGLLTYKLFWNIKTKSNIQQGLKEMPDFTFEDINNRTYSLSNIDPHKSTIFIYFNTECDHCQYEVRELKNNINKFSNTSILLISSEPISIIKEFYKNYSLENIQNIKILKDQHDSFYKIFSTRMIPSVYVYNKDKKLIDIFKGETKMDAIINSINK